MDRWQDRALKLIVDGLYYDAVLLLRRKSKSRASRGDVLEVIALAEWDYIVRLAMTSAELGLPERALVYVTALWRLGAAGNAVLAGPCLPSRSPMTGRAAMPVPPTAA
jgi:hypothetical protein